VTLTGTLTGAAVDYSSLTATKNEAFPKLTKPLQQLTDTARELGERRVLREGLAWLVAIMAPGFTYVYQLPWGVRADLVATLNAGEIWRDLAGRRLGYGHLDLQRFSEARYKPGSSPAEAMLLHWGQRNGTAEELFKHLHAMGLHQSMAVLRDSVAPELRGLMRRAVGPEREASTAVVGQRPPPPSTDHLYRENLYQPGQDVDDFESWDMGHECQHEASTNRRDWTTDANIGLPQDMAVKRCVPVTQPQPVAAVTGARSSRLAVTPNIQSTSPGAATGGTEGGTTAAATSMSRLKQRMPSGVPLPSASQDGDNILLNNIDFDELKACCGGFDREKEGVLIGRGGFGEVFRGRLHGQDVAVKRISEEKRFQVGEEAYQRIVNQAITELQTLHSYPAENILPLLAISFDPAYRTEPCLVYQLMPDGSVSDRLKRRDATPPLSWHQRANIAVGTARGLEHLHANNIIHGDIKSGNVLLDKHFEPKIGDFGLARGGPEDSDCTFLMVSMVRGTQVYLPDDYIRSRQLTAAVDTFCYGIFAFELVSGKSPSFAIPGGGDYPKMRDFMLNADLPEPHVDDSVPPSYWSHLLFYVGKDCAKKSRKQRPQMRLVSNALDVLIRQPTGAMALQTYFDEKKVRNRTASCSTATEATPAQAPPLQDKRSQPNVEEDTYSASSFSVITEEKSLANLSAYLSRVQVHRPAAPAAQPQPATQQADLIPELSALRVEAAPAPSSAAIPDLSFLRMPASEANADRLTAVDSALAAASSSSAADPLADFK